MIDNAALKTILQTATDLSTVVEFYGTDEVPTASGFDPANALLRLSDAANVNFYGEPYGRYVKSFGKINRKITGESNTASVELSNLDNYISNFELTYGFEGLIMVVRLISRSQSTTLATSMILFTGRCEKPKSGNKQALSVTANWILGGLEVTVPRRKYTKEDQEGRVTTDADFEGFVFIPQYGTSSYSVRVKRGGLLGLFGFKKTVQKTLQYSSYSDLDATKPVPLVLGRAQLVLSHIAYDDVGTYVRVRCAAADGPIYDIQNARSINSLMPLSGADYFDTMGLVGAANKIPAGSWVGDGNYSRTACIVGKCTNSAVDAVEPAPDIVAVIFGSLVTNPDGPGSWAGYDEYSDNGASQVRFILTSPDYYNLNEAWTDFTEFYNTYAYNEELIVDRSINDFIFAVEG